MMQHIETDHQIELILIFQPPLPTNPPTAHVPLYCAFTSYMVIW